MSAVQTERIVVVSKKPIREYLIEIALMFQEGANTLVLKGHGKFISKAVDLYNAALSKMGESIELVDISIGSDSMTGRFKPYIAIRIKRKY
ncbi:MAG: DNA-binding protein [Desulfurococcaceae archaeon]